jgi:ribosomal protein L13E
LSAAPSKKRASGKKESESKRVVKEKASKPTGALPSAIVEVRHGGRMVQRQASGYSLREVAQAGLNFGLARKWGLLVDGRRRSALEGNVASLKKWSPQTKKTTEERVEGELRKIEMVVEEEVRKVEKEAEKMEKKVEKAEKRVKKVEKELVEKAEAPIKKRSKKKAAAKSKSSSSSPSNV